MIVPPFFKTGLDDQIPFDTQGAKIVLISGQSGSGKTTLGNELAKYENTLIHDTDDINDAAFGELKASSDEFRKALDSEDADTYDGMRNRLAREKRNDIIRQGKDKVIVFVGITISFDDIKCDKYYIDLDVDVHYRRLSLRTLDEICSNADKIRDTIGRETPTAGLHIINNEHGVKQRFPIDYKKMKGFLAQAKDSAREAGFTVMESSDILKKIISKYDLRRDSDSNDPKSEVQTGGNIDYAYKYHKYKSKYVNAANKFRTKN